MSETENTALEHSQNSPATHHVGGESTRVPRGRVNRDHGRTLGRSVRVLFYGGTPWVDVFALEYNARSLDLYVEDEVATAQHALYWLHALV